MDDTESKCANCGKEFGTKIVEAQSSNNKSPVNYKTFDCGWWIYEGVNDDGTITSDGILYNFCDKVCADKWEEKYPVETGTIKGGHH